MKTVRAAMLAAIGLGGLAPLPGAAAAPLYHLIASIPLGGGIRWDYLHFDAPSDRLYVSHGDRVDVVDARRDEVIGALVDLPGSHGIAVDPHSGLVYADSAVDGEVVAFDPRSLRPVSRAKVLPDADGISYDPLSRQIFVSGGDGDGVTPVSTVTGKAAPTIGFGSSPEFHVADGKGSLYVDLVDADEIARIDSRADRLIARWPLAPCRQPKGLAIDPARRLLFASCASGVMAVVDADSGALVATLPIGRRTDGAGFDPVRQRAFSANGDGTLSIISDAGGRVTSLGTLQTEKGARTLAVDPASGRIFLVTGKVAGLLVPASAGAPAKYAFAPGSLHVLIYAP